ncbi:BLUF domain-containing protein, partial [Durusdinium trenchii]
MSVFRLVYHSVLTPTEEFEGRESELIEMIRQRSAENNKKKEISGVLLFNETTNELIQVLEGDEELVRNLFQVISQDTRHSDVTVHLEKKTKDRQYKEWGMLKGAAKDWKAVKMTLPGSINGKVAGTFDEAFKLQAEAAPIAALPAKKKKGGLFACFRNGDKTVVHDPNSTMPWVPPPPSVAVQQARRAHAYRSSASSSLRSELRQQEQRERAAEAGEIENEDDGRTASSASGAVTREDEALRVDLEALWRGDYPLETYGVYRVSDRLVVEERSPVDEK